MSFRRWHHDDVIGVLVWDSYLFRYPLKLVSVFSEPFQNPFLTCFLLVQSLLLVPTSVSRTRRVWGVYIVKTLFSGSRIPSRNPPDLPRIRGKSFPKESSKPSRGIHGKVPLFFLPILPPKKCGNNSRNIVRNIQNLGWIYQNQLPNRLTVAGMLAVPCQGTNPIADFVNRFETQRVL